MSGCLAIEFLVRLVGGAKSNQGSVDGVTQLRTPTEQVAEARIAVDSYSRSNQPVVDSVFSVLMSDTSGQK